MVRPRPSVLVTIAVLCIAAGAGRAQYVEDSIDVGGTWTGSLAYNSRADVIYGACEGGAGTFFAVSCDSNRVVAQLRLYGALWVCYDSLDNKAYCTYHDYNWNDSLLVVDGSTHARVKAISIPGATIAVWDPVSDRVYVSCQNSAQVAVVDARDDSILTYIPVGACPIKMYMNTRRHKLYVLNYDAGTVSIVNVTANKAIKTVSVGGNPNAGYYCRSADKFYSAGRYEECVVIGGRTDTVIARIPVPGTEDLLCATGNEQSGIVFAGMFAGNSGYIIAIDAEADTVLYTHDLGHAFAQGLLYSMKIGYVYSANYGSSVSVLTGDGSRVVKVMSLGAAPFALASAPSHDRVYVGNLGTRWLYVLRDNEAVTAAPSPESEGAMRVTPNPFAHSVAVAWDSARKGGDVHVYARDGRLVKQARIPAGENRWVWDGRDDSGAPLPPGVYVIEAGPGLRAKVVKLR
jgi:YVTN family beta-propeller protein